MYTILNLPDILGQFKNARVSYGDNYDYSYRVTISKFGESRLSSSTFDIIEPICCLYNKIRKVHNNTFEVTVFLPGGFLHRDSLDIVKESFKVGSAITLTNFRGENWFLINSREFPETGIMLLNITLISEGKLKKVKQRNKTYNLIFPLNQYNRGFENADIFKFCTEFETVPSIIKNLTDHDSCI